MFYVHVVKTLFLFTTLPPHKGGVITSFSENFFMCHVWTPSPDGKMKDMGVPA
jgi:hypothetical protein